jgi:hypothetical protein
MRQSSLKILKPSKHLRRQSSDAGDGNSVLLRGGSGDFSQPLLTSSEPKMYGSTTRRRDNRIPPHLPRKISSTGGREETNSFQNFPSNTGDQIRLQLATALPHMTVTGYGSDDVLPNITSHDREEEATDDLHPLLMP